MVRDANHFHHLRMAIPVTLTPEHVRDEKVQVCSSSLMKTPSEKVS